MLLCNPRSAALQKRLHIHPHSEGLSPGCSHLGCRNYQNPSKGRGCLAQLSPVDPKDPQRSCDLRMPPMEGRGSMHLSRVSLIVRGPFIYGAQVQLYESVSTNFQVWCTFARLPWLSRPRNNQNQEGKRVSGPGPCMKSRRPPRIRVLPPGLCSVSEHLCYWVWSEDDPRHIFQK